MWETRALFLSNFVQFDKILHFLRNHKPLSSGCSLPLSSLLFELRVPRARLGKSPSQYITRNTCTHWDIIPREPGILMHIPALLKSGGSNARKKKKKAVAKRVKSNKSTQHVLRERHREHPHGWGNGGVHQLELSARTFIKWQLLLHHL